MKQCDDSWNPTRKEDIIRYLRNGNAISCTSKMAFPCVIDGDDQRSSLCDRTDEVWHWLDDLEHYVDQHGVRLPDKFVEHIVSQNYSISEKTLASFEGIDNPPLLSVTNKGNRGLILADQKMMDDLVFAEESFGRSDYLLAWQIFGRYKGYLKPDHIEMYRIAYEKIGPGPHWL